MSIDLKYPRCKLGIMEQRVSSFLRTLAWVMLFVTFEILFLLFLSFEKYWVLYLFWIIESILGILLFLLGRLACRKVLNEYSNLTTTLFFFNLVFFAAMFAVGPYLLDIASNKLFDLGCGCNFPAITQMIFDISKPLKDWGIFSVIFIYVFSFLNFLIITHNSLITKQRILQVFMLLIMVAICFYCWYVTSDLFYKSITGFCGG